MRYFKTLVIIIGLSIGIIDGISMEPETSSKTNTIDSISSNAHQEKKEEQSQISFDLPPETPGLQNGGNPINYNGKSCIKVIIPSAEHSEPNRERRSLIDNSPIPNNDETSSSESFTHGTENYNIYFPVDAIQPKAQDVAEYSCANVADTEDSHITKWYMKMFGWIENERDQNVKAGYTINKEAAPIFTFQNSNDKAEFWNIFRNVAKTPLGRALLYRILIEIRRKKSDGQGCYPSAKLRQFFRTLRIKKADRFHFSTSSIEYCTAVPCKFELVKDGYIVLTNPQNLDTNTELSIILFHEMLHWFHDLFDDDYHEKTEGCSLCHSFDQRDQNVVYKYYYESEENDETFVTNSLQGWSVSLNKINTEEWRTIAGINYELSENAFRVSVGVPLRIFHAGAPSVADERKNGRCKIIETVDSTDNRYRIPKEGNIDNVDNKYCGCLRYCFSCLSSHNENDESRASLTSFEFLCLGKEDTQIVSKMQQEALQCCRNYCILDKEMKVDDIGIHEANFDIDRAGGVGNAFFFK